MRKSWNLGSRTPKSIERGKGNSQDGGVGKLRGQQLCLRLREQPDQLRAGQVAPKRKTEGEQRAQTSS